MGSIVWVWEVIFSIRVKKKKEKENLEGPFQDWLLSSQRQEPWPKVAKLTCQAQLQGFLFWSALPTGVG
jgi:UDP-N-acetylenolpyruvoylglucosamine reductase